MGGIPEFDPGIGGGTIPDPTEGLIPWDVRPETYIPGPVPGTSAPTLPTVGVGMPSVPSVQDTAATIMAITEAVTETTTQQTVRALQPLVASQTQVVASGMNLQSRQQMQSNTLLSQILRRLNKMPSIEDYRQIMLETQETGGF